MADFTPWKNMSADAPVQPEPSSKGTKRENATMLNEKLTLKKKRKMGTHWELPKKLKLTF